MRTPVRIIQPVVTACIIGHLSVGCHAAGVPADPPSTADPGGDPQRDATPESAEFQEAASVDAPAEEDTESQAGSPSKAAPAGQREPMPLPEGTKVLHIGDSFAGALGKPLGIIFEEAGIRSVLKHTDSSYLTDWAWDGKLQEYIWKYNPDLIMVTLGANELEIVNPELRERTVKKIISTIGERPCVWVAIPLWEGPKNGLLDVIEQHASPCIYMDTNQLIDVAKMPRISDGIHPTTQAREDWATFVAGWLRKHRAPREGRPWNLQP